MIKKLIIIGSVLLSSLTTTQVLARPLMCPFTDFFSIQGSADTVIKNLLTDGNLSGDISNDTHFTTFCKSYTSTGSGHAYLTVNRGASVCDLTILDGPFESNPSIVEVKCLGSLQYIGMDHPKGSYNYTIKFS
jgi:hypothetical protein